MGTYDIYCKVEPSTGKSPVKNILMYLYSTENLNLLTMVQKFEEYIGPISMISDDDKKGLHQLTEGRFLPEVINLNKENITIILREMNLSELV
jgi:hypothetical protein